MDLGDYIEAALMRRSAKGVGVDPDSPTFKDDLQKAHADAMEQVSKSNVFHPGGRKSTKESPGPKNLGELWDWKAKKRTLDELMMHHGVQPVNQKGETEGE